MDHTSKWGGYTYMAGEMSIPAPVGLSGGPLFRPRTGAPLLGVVVENMESALTLPDSTEERTRDGSLVEVTERRNVVSYGVAVMPSRVADWLDKELPVAAAR